MSNNDVVAWFTQSRFRRVPSDELGDFWNEAPKSAILFLTTDGVCNPSMWEYWAAAAPMGLVDMFVHAPRKPEFGASFCDKYRLNSDWAKSKWCEPSVVYESVKALSALCKRYKPWERVIIHLVSGKTIPVKPYTFLTRDRAYVSRVASHPWWSLTIHDARRIVSHLVENDLMGLAKASMKMNARGCPDEFVIRDAMVALNLENDAISQTFAPYEFAKEGTLASHEPAVWNDLDDMKSIIPTCTWKISLKSILYALRHTWDDADMPLFFSSVTTIQFQEWETFMIEKVFYANMYSPNIDLALGPLSKSTLSKKSFDCSRSLDRYDSPKMMDVVNRRRAFFIDTYDDSSDDVRGMTYRMIRENGFHY